MIIHHARRDGGQILTAIVRDGFMVLDPPGLELAVSDIYDPR